MKLYTRTGDDGTTGFFGGGRASKDHPRIDAIGEVDETNAAIGLAIAAVPKGGPSHAAVPPFWNRLRVILTELQSRLFDLGADLATPHGTKHEAKTPRIAAALISQAELWIDEVDGGNEPIRQFVLPGGAEVAARLHLARAICRRAERAMVHLARSEEVNPQAIVFINRTSDLLFAMARRANREAGVNDVPWIPGARPAETGAPAGGSTPGFPPTRA